MIDLHSFIKSLSKVGYHCIVTWERSRGCGIPSATVDAETMRLYLLAATLALNVALAGKQMSRVQKILPSTCIEEAACDRSPILSGRACGTGSVFKQDSIDFCFRFASEKWVCF